MLKVYIPTDMYMESYIGTCYSNNLGRINGLRTNNIEMTILLTTILVHIKIEKGQLIKQDKTKVR